MTSDVAGVQSVGYAASASITRSRGAGAGMEIGALPPKAASRPDAVDIRFGNISLPADRSLEQTAEKIRYARHALGNIQTYIDRMKAALTHIVKQFPPYGFQSTERIDQLKAYGGIRKLIDAVTIPPDNHYLGTLIADPAQLPEAGNIEIPSHSGEQIIVHAQPAHTGEYGLALPSLDPYTASDQQVADTLVKVESAYDAVVAKKAQLTADVQLLGNSIPESVAGAVGLATRSQFADMPSLGISQGGDAVLSSLTDAA
jgi:hypothetical protein